MLSGRLALDSVRRLPPASDDAGTMPAKRHRPSYQVHLSEEVLSLILSGQSHAVGAATVELDLGSDPVGFTRGSHVRRVGSAFLHGPSFFGFCVAVDGNEGHTRLVGKLPALFPVFG
jgi:hypothetical protein